MVTSGWAQDFWNTTIISQPTNQKKLTHPAALTLDFAYKNFSPKAIEFRVLLRVNHPFSVFGPAENLPLLETDTSVCLASLGVGRRNLHSKTGVIVGSLFTSREGSTQRREKGHSANVREIINDQCFLWKELQLKGANDGRNFHMLRYGEIMLAYRWFILNFRLTSTACLWPIKHTLYICFNH